MSNRKRPFSIKMMRNELKGRSRTVENWRKLYDHCSRQDQSALRTSFRFAVEHNWPELSLHLHRQWAFSPVSRFHNGRNVVEYALDEGDQDKLWFYWGEADDQERNELATYSALCMAATCGYGEFMRELGRYDAHTKEKKKTHKPVIEFALLSGDFDAIDAAIELNPEGLKPYLAGWVLFHSENMTDTNYDRLEKPISNPWPMIDHLITQGLDLSAVRECREVFELLNLGNTHRFESRVADILKLLTRGAPFDPDYLKEKVKYAERRECTATVIDVYDAIQQGETVFIDVEAQRRRLNSLKPTLTQEALEIITPLLDQLEAEYFADDPGADEDGFLMREVVYA